MPLNKDTKPNKKQQKETETETETEREIHWSKSNIDEKATQKMDQKLYQLKECLENNDVNDRIE